ncbi:alpha/beta fold hydrolase [Phycicoccus ginsengisoli]
MAIQAWSALLATPVRRGGLMRGTRRLCWVESGSGSPALILVSGCGDTALEWMGVMGSLAQCSRVIAFDRAGLGASDPATTLTIETEIDDLTAVLTEVGTAVLVGHSWGGLLAQLVAFAHPEMVAGLVLIDPPHEDLAAVWRWPDLALSSVGVALDRVRLLERATKGAARKLALRCTDDEQVKALIEDAYVASCSSPGQIRMVRQEAWLTERSRAFIRRSRATSSLPDGPLVVLSATKGKPRRLAESSTALHVQVVAAAPQGRHVIADDAGHYIHHDRPDLVTRTVAEVVAAVRAQRG